MLKAIAITFGVLCCLICIILALFCGLIMSPIWKNIEEEREGKKYSSVQLDNREDGR